MTAPTKRQFNKAIKDAITDRKIPDAKDYICFRYGMGYSAEYGLYWKRLGLSASFRQRADRTFYLEYATEIEKGSHMETNIVEWVPA